MDIPLSKDLNVRTPIGVKTKDGVVQLFLLRSMRGDQSDKWTLTIEAICAKQFDWTSPCQVCFRGNEIACRFTKVNESDGLWLVTFEATIGIPEYWGES